MKNLVYAVNVDCDCMLGLNFTLGNIIRWFGSEEARESYEDDYDEVTLKCMAIEYLSKKLVQYKGGKLLSDVLDLSWNEI